MIAVLSKFSNCVERASIDEAYIDLTEEVKKRMDASRGHDVTPEQLPNTFIVGWGDDKDGSVYFIIFIIVNSSLLFKDI